MQNSQHVLQDEAEMSHPFVNTTKQVVPDMEAILNFKKV